MTATHDHSIEDSPDDKRLELALRASNEGIWDWWTDQTAIYYSHRILEFLEGRGRQAPNFFLPPHEAVHEEDRPEFERALAEAFDPGGPEILSIDCRVRTGGGSWRWLRIRGIVVRNREGKAIRIAGSMIDISRRRAAESQIEEERHVLSTLIDHVPLQIYFKDRESRFVLVNKRMAAWNGERTPEEVIGKHDRDFFAYEHWKEAYDDEQRIMETRQAITNKLEHEVREDGTQTWVVTSKFPWLDRKGRLRGTFGVSSDVTDLVLAQREAAGLARELAARNKTYEEEVQLAREIQQALSGSHFPDIHDRDRRLHFGARYLPSSGLAGDFFEVFRISDRVAGLLICDVMGHGVRSALIVAMLRGLLEKQRSSAADPSRFLRGLNSGLAAILERADATVFATAFYAVVDLDGGVLRCACAGHPGAIVEGPRRVFQTCRHGSERGPALGLLGGANFPTCEIPLGDITRLLLFTDGIIEAENDAGEAFLEERLMTFLASRQDVALTDLLDGILTTVRSFSRSNHFEDDVCLLGLEITPRPPRSDAGGNRLGLPLA